MVRKDDHSKDAAVEGTLAINYARRFGQVAIKMGFLSADQVDKALEEQITYNSFVNLRRRKLIGEILFENGWITLKQIERVLDVVTKE